MKKFEKNLSYEKKKYFTDKVDTSSIAITKLEQNKTLIQPRVRNNSLPSRSQKPKEIFLKIKGLIIIIIYKKEQKKKS